jgi:hypothetical protein
MEDSPLSITASVTGILTFIVAIIAFIYVRYSTLRQGDNEMSTILESVSATIVETRAMAQMMAQPSDRSESTQLEKIIADIYSLEIDILSDYYKAFGVKRSTTLLNLDLRRNCDDLDWEESFLRQRNQLSSTKSTGNPWTQLLPDGYTVMDAMKFVFTMGTTPTLLRWYMVRDKVLEKIRQRDIIRSRLQFHQMSLVNMWVCVKFITAQIS